MRGGVGGGVGVRGGGGFGGKLGGGVRGGEMVHSRNPLATSSAVQLPRSLMSPFACRIAIATPCHHVKNTTPLMHKNL